MNCTHRSEIPGICHCKLVDIGFAAKLCPCEQCVSEWIGEAPPTTDTLTPTLVAVAINGVAKPRTAHMGQPTLSSRIRSAAKAFAKFVASGGALLDRETTGARRAVCDGCEYRTSFLRAGVCGKCGCAIALKSQLPKEHCPLGKWENGFATKRCCGGLPPS